MVKSIHYSYISQKFSPAGIEESESAEDTEKENESARSGLFPCLPWFVT
jgi:hypothetical protein